MIVEIFTHPLDCSDFVGVLVDDSSDWTSIVAAINSDGGANEEEIAVEEDHGDYIQDEEDEEDEARSSEIAALVKQVREIQRR
jgi:hypothetical protein